MNGRLEEFGLRCWHGSVVHLQHSAHIHNEVEVNMVRRGSITYLLGGQRVVVHEGQFALFWAAIPHQLVWCVEGAELGWITIPLATFLGWKLPRGFNRAILGGKLLAEPNPERAASDASLLRQWDAAVGGGGELQRRIFLLQLEARLCELALTLEQEKSTEGEWARPGKESVAEGVDLGRVERMTAFVAENYTRPLTVPEISRAVGLTPNYASDLFKASFGFGLTEFVLRTRLAHAQRLLVTGSASVMEVAYASGFGSSARFHAAFKAALGVSPARYRKTMSPRERGAA